MRLCVFEDNAVSNLQPLTLTRPAFDLRCGATTLLDKQLRSCGVHTAGALVRPELADLCRHTHPELAVNDPDWLRAAGNDETILLVNARWLDSRLSLRERTPFRGAKGDTVGDCRLSLRERTSFRGAKGDSIGLVGEQVAYLVLPAGEAAGLTMANLDWRLASWKLALSHRPAGGAMIDYPWDLLERHAEAMDEDYRHARAQGGWTSPAGMNVVGPAERLLVVPSARIEPMVLIDTTRGPVLIDRGAIVQAFSRIEGPCYVGPETQVLGARLRGGSLGPQCRVGGEVEASILHGFTNKAHDGFLGHSYLGEWVNLGAGTQVSDLRTDYSMVRVSLNGRKVDTGLLKLGAIVGDHTKTSVNALLNTGTLVGPFGQLLTSGALLPRSLPAFCRFGHGQVQERTDLREMFAAARTALARRQQEWTEVHAEFYFGLYERTATERRQLMRESEQRRLRRVV